MSDFHDYYPSYEKLAHHSEEEGKTKRRKLWNVFWIMLGITLLELYIGFQQEAWHLKGTVTLKVIFIGLTVVKAAYIVLSFMHLGDETKVFRYLVLVPFIVFVVYLISLVDVLEGNYSKTGRYDLDKVYLMKAPAHGHGAEHTTTPAEHSQDSHENNNTEHH
jgi:cytochrome c oxidase subunit IV